MLKITDIDKFPDLDIGTLRHFPVFSGLRTFHSCSFCLILLYYHHFMCEMHLEIPKSDDDPIITRYRVTGVLMEWPSALRSRIIFQSPNVV